MPGWRVIFVVAVGLSTSGCLFSAYQIASLTASGISYMVSGRSVGDHALSLALEQDCATHRILKGDEICIDFPQDDMDSPAAVAQAPDLPEYDSALDDAPDVRVADAVAAVPPVQMAEFRVAGFADAVTPEPGVQPRVTPASVPPPPADNATPAIEPGIFLVIGSFQNSENAEKLGAEHNDMNTAIMALDSGGRTMFRVVAGPIDDGELGHARSRFLKAGIRNTWAVRLCQGNLALPPCRENMLQQAQLPVR